MLGQLRPVMITRQHDIGKALVITQQNIETRHHLLDEIDPSSSASTSVRVVTISIDLVSATMRISRVPSALTRV